MIYDITRTITPQIAVWPGDHPFSFTFSQTIKEGSAVNVTRITLSPHTGTHCDAYYHFDDNGVHPPAMPLDAYIGKARVVTVSKTDEPILPEDVGDMTGVERLLIHSAVSDMPDTSFAHPYPYLSVELVNYLGEKGVKLIGLDSPSVDAFDSKDLPCHHAIQANGLANLELLQLRDVPDGDYELVALPLKIDGICGTPVRAILRTLST